MTAQRISAVHRHLRIPAHTRELKRVRDAVAELSQPVLTEQAHLYVLAVDEALANVILHGAPAGEIEIFIAGGRGEIEVRILDDGTPHDPGAVMAAHPAERTLKRQRGGMGVGILRGVMDEILYARLADGRNELRLIKRARAR